MKVSQPRLSVLDHSIISVTIGSQIFYQFYHYNITPISITKTSIGQYIMPLK